MYYFFQIIDNKSIYTIFCVCYTMYILYIR